MSKHVLIINSSPRKGGNSETLAASFAKGAEEAGHKVETVYLREKNYSFCKGCLACLKVGHCVIGDDAVEIAARMHDADVLVFATPVYYYSVSGQLKTMLDRANPLFDSDYAFTKAYFKTHKHLQEETIDRTDLMNIRSALLFLAPEFRDSVQTGKEIQSLIAKTSSLLSKH